MAKRKAARAAGRKTAARGGGARGRASTRKTAGRKKTAARRRASAGAAARKRAGGARKAARKSARATRAGAAGRAAGRKKTARKSAARKSAARKSARKAPGARRAATPPRTLPVRKAPALDRERRTVSEDDDLVPTPPSSLDLDRSASASRTGRRELRERYEEHTETSPAITGGDVDADWESAYAVGDEAPGGDSPTPDQDIVDDIGRAVGVEYQDNEELKGADKIARRDKNRWELDPASSDDWDER